MEISDPSEKKNISRSVAISERWQVCSMKSRRRTGDTKILDTSHTQARIHNILRIAQRTHLTSPTRMVRSTRLLLDIFLPLLIVPRKLAALGPRTLDMVLGAGALSDDLVNELDALGEDCEIEGVREIVVVDEGFVEGV